MSRFSDIIKTRRLLFDGSMGALLGQMGFNNACPDEIALTNPDVIGGIHLRYINAGANVIICDSFGSTELVLKHKKREGRGACFTKAAVKVAQRAAGSDVLVAVDIGPTGEFMRPIGSLSFEEMYNNFYAQAQVAAAEGVELAIIETQTDLAECRAACLACRAAGLEVIASFSIGNEGRTLTGSPAECCALALEAAGACAVGLNCSVGPDGMIAPLKAMRRVSPLPVVVQPNAGLPVTDINGDVSYPFTPEDMYEGVKKLVEAGAAAIGGCCGTSPKHIRAIKPLTSEPLPQSAYDGVSYVCSARNFAPIEAALKEVCELTDPEEAYDFEDDVTMANIVLDDMDAATAEEFVLDCCAATKLPLMFTLNNNNSDALEAALRVYPGRAAVRCLDELAQAALKFGCIRV